MRPGTVGEYDIWVVRPDGTGLRRVTESPANRSDYPDWSPDGSVLLFERRKLDPVVAGGDEALYAVDVVTGAERVVYRLPAWAPGSGYAASAPDGKRILFGFWGLYGDSCPASSRSPRNGTLATIHPDGHGLRRLRLNTGADSGTWSPDGKRIAFRCRSGTGLTLSFRLCTSKLNGTSFRRFPGPVGSAEPDWGTHA